MILDVDLTVLYIGKTSMSSSFGKRLSGYFCYAEDRTCKIQYPDWQTPRFVLTIAVPDGYAYEAPALEELLIGKCGPPDNSMGKGSST